MFARAAAGGLKPPSGQLAALVPVPSMRKGCSRACAGLAFAHPWVLHASAAGVLAPQLSVPGNFTIVGCSAALLCRLTLATAAMQQHAEPKLDTVHCVNALLTQCTCCAAPARSWTSLFGGKGSKAAAALQQRSTLSPEEDPDTIHIFTVASGHMYERLQKIMVLSVLRTTKCAVFDKVSDTAASLQPGAGGLTTSACKRCR